MARVFLYAAVRQPLSGHPDQALPSIENGTTAWEQAELSLKMFLISGVIMMLIVLVKHWGKLTAPKT